MAAMETYADLTNSVKLKAKTYLDDTGTPIASMPASIADFVVEYVRENCNFPKSYNEARQVEILAKGINALAMGCVDIFLKSGAEGEVSHSENGISRTYYNTYIDAKIMRNFPRFAKY